MSHADLSVISVAPHVFCPRVAALALLALIIGLACMTGPARAATLTVANLNDDGIGSLRQAIADASAGDTITFANDLSGQTITLTTDELSVTKSLTINGDLNGDGTPDITISGNHASQVFTIGGPATVTLEGLVIKDGNSAFDGGGIFAAGGTLTVSHSTVSGNSAPNFGSGGGIFASGGTLTVSHSTVSGNSAFGGGGIFASGGTLTVSHSTVSGNSAFGGGGIYATGETLTVINSTFASNSASLGGALSISSSPTASIINATFSGNSASTGGAILDWGSALAPALTNVILWDNRAVDGPEIYTNVGPTPTVTYSVVQGGYAGTGNLDADPRFADVGGGDFRLLPGSPAIDTGTNAGAPSDDIRDLPRPFNTAADIGAYEWQGLTLSKSGGDSQSATINTAFANPLTVTVSSAAPSAQAEPVTGAQVTFTAPASGSSATLNPASPVTVACGGSPAVCTTAVNVAANGTAGTYAVSASAAGATPVAFGLTNNPVPATVALSDLGPYTYDGNAKNATCTTAPPSLATGTTYDGSTTPPTNAGDYAVVCTVTDSNYTGSASGTLTIAKANQAIAFNPPASGAVDGNAILSATGGNSGNPIIFVSQTGSVCRVSGNTVNYLTAGACTVRASQAGNANYNAAPDVDRTIPVGKADQAITFNPPASGAVGGSAALSASASSGLSVTFGSQTASVCGVSGSTVSYLTAGACTVRASQAGNANYNAAPDVDRSIAIGPAANTTALASSSNPSTFSQSVTFTAAVTGQNPTGTVAFSADGNPVSGCASVPLTGSGNSKIAACATGALAGGNHAVAAAYSGDANNQTSAGSLQQVVQNVFTGPSATGQGDVTVTFSGGGSGCNLTRAAFVNPPATLPAGYTFPYGLLRFALGDACDGGPVTVQTTYPAALPTGARYWKYGKTQEDPTAHWYEIPAAINGATATFTLTDGGLGDDDLTVNGRIADDGGAGVPADIPTTDIPTLSEWALLLLAGLLGLFGMRRLRQA